MIIRQIKWDFFYLFIKKHFYEYEYYGICSQIQYFKNQNLSFLVKRRCDIKFQIIFESVDSKSVIQAFNTIARERGVGRNKTSPGVELVLIILSIQHALRTNPLDQTFTLSDKGYITNLS